MVAEPIDPDTRRLRLERGLSQQDLAELAGVSRGTIRNAERGSPLEASTAHRIAEALRRFDGAAVTSKQAAGPSLIYTATDGSRHEVDSDLWSIENLPPREQAILRALLDHVMNKAMTNTEGTPDHA
jgi:transcriptional regulator with XRE-family HTH domain